MDRIIDSRCPLIDGDLALVPSIGVAYQRDMRFRRVRYGDDYQKKVDAYDGSDIAERVNKGRCEMLARHLERGSSVLDIGAGSGAFVRAACAAGFKAMGFEVMPTAVARLKAENRFAASAHDFDALTLWDVVEHLEEPAYWFHCAPRGALIFASTPVFTDLRRIRESKHYRPGEHLHYWSTMGFINWADAYGFLCVEFSMHEVEAGRESIGAFAFKRRTSL